MKLYIMKREALETLKANLSVVYGKYYTEIGNAQNGMLADVVDWGIVGTMFFLLIPMGILKHSKYNRCSFPLLCMLYTYIIAGMVDVTMAIRFILALSLFMLLSGYSVEDGQTKKTLIGGNRNII